MQLEYLFYSTCSVLFPLFLREIANLQFALFAEMREKCFFFFTGTVLSCQPRVTVTSCFVYTFIRNFNQ